MLTLLGLWVLAAVPRLTVCTSGDTTTLAPLAEHVRLVQLTSGSPEECRDTSTPRLHFEQRGAEVRVVLTLAGQAPRSRALPWASRAVAALAEVSAARALTGLAVLIEGLWAEALLDAPPPSVDVRGELDTKRANSSGARTGPAAGGAGSHPTIQPTKTWVSSAERRAASGARATGARTVRTATAVPARAEVATATTSTTTTSSSPRDVGPRDVIDATTTTTALARATLSPASPAEASTPSPRSRVPVAPSDERTTSRDPPRDVPLAVVLTVGGRYRTPAAWGGWLAARVQAGPLFARLGLEPHLDFAFDGRALALTSWTAGLGGELALQRLPAVRLHAALELVVHELLERARAGDQTTTTLDLTVVAGGSVRLLEASPLSLGLAIEGLWAPSARALQIPGGAEATLAAFGMRAALEARARW